jgi:glycosyltransferase involved in cell wall biosynthesis
MTTVEAKTKPDLVVLIYNLAATGVTRNAIRIAAAAANRGMHTELWLWQSTGPFAKLVPENVKIVEFGNHSPLLRFGQMRRAGILMKIPALARLIVQKKPQILLSAGNRCHLAASLAWRLAGKPAHTITIARASNANPMFSKTDLISRMLNRFDSLKFQSFQHVISVSRELASELCAIRPQLSSRMSVIPNGVDMSKLAGQKLATPEHAFFVNKVGPVLVSAGTITRQKNFPLLVEAMAIVRKTSPSARLVVLGDSNTTERAKLQAHIHKLGLGDAIDLAGYANDPLRYFHHADAYVLSSLWEGASNSLLEAMACGARIIATDCPTGIRELLDDGKQGAITPLGDPSALARGILQALEKPKPGAERQQWMMQFDLGKCLDAYCTFLEDLLNAAQRPVV